MIINFLQTRNPPILPSLHQIPPQNNDRTQPIESTFADSLESLRWYGIDNKETLGQLLFQFFRYYGFDVNYDEIVVSVRHGRLLSRKEKGWDASSLSKEGRDRLCVEEPINTSRNLGNSADPTAFRGIHLEIRRAFTLSGNGQLDKVCEQYEFPTEEKVTFKKPPSQPRPALLTRSNSQSSKSTKSASNGRGGRNPLRNNGSNPRRASSGATRPLFAQSPPLGASGAEQFSQSNLHDHLYQRYQLLQLQQESLKAQAQLMAQAQAQARLYKQAQSSQLPSHGSNSISEGSRSTKQSSPRLMASDRHVQAAYTLFPGYVYQYPSAYEIVHGGQPPAAHEGANSNPSSPALPHAVSANRRGLHRNMNFNELPGGTVRSHSQPARRGPGLIPTRLVVPPGYDASNLVKVSGPTSHQNGYEMSMNMTPAYTAVPATLIDSNTPKEYVGYYLNEASSLAPNLSDITMQHAFPRDTAQRRRRITPELQPPKLNAPFRHASRSPSPLGHYRSFSTGLRTAPLPTSSSSSSSHQQQRQYPEDAKRLPEDYRPVIVNGSTPAHVLGLPDRSSVNESNGIPAPFSYNRPSNTDDKTSAECSNHFNQIIYDELAQPPLRYRVHDSTLTSPKAEREREVGHLNDVNGLEEYQQHRNPRGPIETNNSPLICSSSTSSAATEAETIGIIPRNVPIQQPPHLPLPSRDASVHINPNDPFFNGPINERTTSVTATAVSALPQTQARGHARSINAIPLKSGLSALDLARARVPVETAFAKQAAASGVAGNAVLSPVFETRTPSPSSLRKNDGSTMTNGFRKPAGSSSGQRSEVAYTAGAPETGDAAAPVVAAAAIAPAVPAIATSNTGIAATRLPNRTNGITPAATTAPPPAVPAVTIPLDNKANLPRKENFMVPSIPSRMTNDNAANIAVTPLANNVSNVSNSYNTNPWQRSVGNKKGDRNRSKSNVYAAPGAVIANGTMGGTSNGTSAEARNVGDSVRVDFSSILKGG